MANVWETFEAQRDVIVQHAIDNTLSATQIFNATRQQIESIVADTLSDGWFTNVRRHAAMKLREQEDQADMQGVMTKLAGWVEQRFPNAEFERRRIRGKRQMIIHFDGLE